MMAWSGGMAWRGSDSSSLSIKITSISLRVVLAGSRVLATDSKLMKSNMLVCLPLIFGGSPSESLPRRVFGSKFESIDEFECLLLFLIFLFRSRRDWLRLCNQKNELRYIKKHHECSKSIDNFGSQPCLKSHYFQRLNRNFFFFYEKD